jgi:hypothetical protein
MLLFHVSPKKLKTIDPQKSQGAQQRSWYCDNGMLAWALQHIAKHHGVEECDLYIHVIRPVSMNTFTPMRPGIYTTHRVYVPVAAWRLS